MPATEAEHLAEALRNPMEPVLARPGGEPSPIEQFRVGGSLIRMWTYEHVDTVISGQSVPAGHDGSQAQKDLAKELGYGDDVSLMCIEHEIAHTLLAHWLMRKPSPVLAAVSLGGDHQLADYEEAACLALQGWARRMGVSLVDVARREDA